MGDQGTYGNKENKRTDLRERWCKEVNWNDMTWDVTRFVNTLINFKIT
jgi:hypothetical protein